MDLRRVAPYESGPDAARHGTANSTVAPAVEAPVAPRVSRFARSQWRNDRFRRPAVQYERRWMLHQAGKERFLGIDEYESLAGFEPSHTFNCLNSKGRRMMASEWGDIRDQLLWYSANALILAWMASDLLHQLERIRAPLDLNELVTFRVRLLPVPDLWPQGSDSR